MDPGDILREAVAPGRGGTNIVQQGWQELVVKGDLRTNTKSDKYVNNQWTKKQQKKKKQGTLCSMFPPTLGFTNFGGITKR